MWCPEDSAHTYLFRDQFPQAKFLDEVDIKTCKSGEYSVLKLLMNAVNPLSMIMRL